MLRRLDESALATGNRRSIFSRVLGPFIGRAGERVALPYFILAAILVPIAVFALAVAGDRSAVEAEARDRLVLMRDAVAEHAERVFQAHRFVAFAIQDRIAAMDWDEIAASSDLQAFLGRIEQGFPEVHAIGLVDGQGTLRASSRGSGIGMDLSERPWFVRAREAGPPVVIGAVQRGVIHDDVFFSVTLPRAPADAPFDGVVRISISPAYFTDFYASAYPDDDLIAIVHEDGAVLVAYPPEAGLPERIEATSPGLALARMHDSLVFEGKSGFDGVSRIHAFTRLADLPLIAAVAASRTEIDTVWQRRALGFAAYFVPAFVALLLLGSLAWRSHRELEETVALRTNALSQAVAEKDQLLKEVHHRVKNNMQIVSSLIRMQERLGGSTEDTVRRVQAMALVHDLVYSHGEFASVNLGAYARRLCETLALASDQRNGFDLDLDHVAVTLDRAMPFALILTEVVTAALPQAGQEGRLAIGLRRVEGRAVLTLACGPGRDRPRPDGFGMKLVDSLAVQLGARIAFAPREGVAFEMDFPLDDPMHPGAA